MPPPRSFSQATTSFIASSCQGIHPVRLVAWPYNPKECHNPKATSHFNSYERRLERQRYCYAWFNQTSFFEKTSIRLLKNRRCLRVCARRNVLAVKTTKPLGVADNEWILFFRIYQTFSMTKFVRARRSTRKHSYLCDECSNEALADLACQLFESKAKLEEV